MAEQAIPTFKLVLVGDGGTGKVCSFFLIFVQLLHVDGLILVELSSQIGGPYAWPRIHKACNDRSFG